MSERTNQSGALPSAWELPGMPPMTGNGIEPERRVALLSLTYGYLYELDMAGQMDAVRTPSDSAAPGPLPSDFGADMDGYRQAYVTWIASDPSDTARVEQRWGVRLGFESTGNLQRAFSGRGGFGDNETMQQLRIDDPNLFTACHTAVGIAEKGTAAPEVPWWKQKSTDLMHKVVDQWLARTYMSRAQARLRELGVSAEDIKALQG